MVTRVFMMASIMAMAMIAAPTCVMLYRGALKLQTDETSTAKERDSVKRHITVLKVRLTFISLFAIFTALMAIYSMDYYRDYSS